MPEITDIYTYDISNMIIEDPTENSPPSNPNIKYLLANIKTKLSNGRTGDLIISTEKCFSKGIRSGFVNEGGEITGYTLPLHAYDRDGPTKAQKKWVEAFEKIIEACKDYVYAHRKDFKKPRLEKVYLNKLASSVIWWPEDEETGERLDRGPILYPKLLFNKSSKEIKTRFYRMGTVTRLDDPLSLFEQYGEARAALKIESIYVSGDKIRLQIKVLEADYRIKDSGASRLLPVSGPGIEEGDDENWDDKSTKAVDGGSIDAGSSDSESDSEEVGRVAVAKK